MEKNVSPLDAEFWGELNNQICEFSAKGELVADWHKMRECYDVYMANKDVWEACGGDRVRFGRILVGAAIWKARNS